MQHIVPVFEEDLAPWDEVSSLSIDRFPWYSAGLKQRTKVKIARTPTAIRIFAQAEDVHCNAEIRAFHGSVHLDSCFEFFLTPQNKLGAPYLNFEWNCIGNMHLAYGPSGDERTLAPPEIAAQVKIKVSLSPRQIKIPLEQSWSLDITIPLALIETLSAFALSHDKCFANFYRCGGIIDPQYACWNPIDFEVPSFHRPEQFGELFFLKSAITSATM